MDFMIVADEMQMPLEQL